MNHYQNAKFLLSVAELSQLPPDEGIEVAFVGRSNAGKSSVLNQLTGNKALARVSKTPGRTQHINLFTLDETRRLADLPGYGFAKVPLNMKLKWQETLSNYLYRRGCLKGLVLVMDIRHPLKEFDQNLLAWCAESNLPVHILLNKEDKLSQKEVRKQLKFVEDSLANFPNELILQAFSASKGTGVSSLRKQLDQWFEY